MVNNLNEEHARLKAVTYYFEIKVNVVRKINVIVYRNNFAWDTNYPERDFLKCLLCEGVTYGPLQSKFSEWWKGWRSGESTRLLPLWLS